MFDTEVSCSTNCEATEPVKLRSNGRQFQGQHSTKRAVKPPRSKVLGDMSYSDIIAMAINSSAEKKMTLSQIYQWISFNIPYFKNKSTSECSSSNAGWKVNMCVPFYWSCLSNYLNFCCLKTLPIWTGLFKSWLTLTLC